MGTKTILGNREHRKQIFDFWGTGEQAHLFQGNKGTGTPLPLGGPHCYFTYQLNFSMERTLGIYDHLC